MPTAAECADHTPKTFNHGEIFICKDGSEEFDCFEYRNLIVGKQILKCIYGEETPLTISSDGFSLWACKDVALFAFESPKSKFLFRPQTGIESKELNKILERFSTPSIYSLLDIKKFLRLPKKLQREATELLVPTNVKRKRMEEPPYHVEEPHKVQANQEQNILIPKHNIVQGDIVIPTLPSTPIQPPATTRSSTPTQPSVSTPPSTGIQPPAHVQSSAPNLHPNSSQPSTLIQPSVSMQPVHPFAPILPQDTSQCNTPAQSPTPIQHSSHIQSPNLVKYSTPVQSPSPVRHSTPDRPPNLVQHSTPVKHSILIQRSTPVRYSTPIQSPSPVQRSIHTQYPTPVQHSTPVQRSVHIQPPGSIKTSVPVPIQRNAYVKPLVPILPSLSTQPPTRIQHSFRSPSNPCGMPKLLDINTAHQRNLLLHPLFSQHLMFLEQCNHSKQTRNGAQLSKPITHGRLGCFDNPIIVEKSKQSRKINNVPLRRSIEHEISSLQYHQMEMTQKQAYIMQEMNQDHPTRKPIALGSPTKPLEQHLNQKEPLILKNYPHRTGTQEKNIVFDQKSEELKKTAFSNWENLQKTPMVIDTILQPAKQESPQFGTVVQRQPISTNVSVLRYNEESTIDCVINREVQVCSKETEQSGRKKDNERGLESLWTQVEAKLHEDNEKNTMEEPKAKQIHTFSNDFYLETEETFFFQLQDDFTSLASHNLQDVPFYDVIFSFPDNIKFYSCKSLLGCRSPYFSRLFFEHSNESTLYLDIQLTTFNWITSYPIGFYYVLCYLCTNKIPLDKFKEDPCAALITGLLSTNLEIQTLHQKCSSFMKSHIEETIKPNKLIGQALDILVFSEQHEDQIKRSDPIILSVRDILYSEASEVLYQHEFLHVTKAFVLDLLQKGNFLIDEGVIFNRILKWIKANSYDRKDVEDLLSEIRYEFMTPEELHNSVVQSNLFSTQELLQMFRACIQAENNQPYMLFGKQFDEPRTRRQAKELPHLLSQLSVSFTSSINEIQKCNNTMNSEMFDFSGYKWYICFIIKQEHLSLFLYNHNVMENGRLPTPLLVRTTFSILNDVDRPKVSVFKATWDTIRGWGYSNYIPLSVVNDSIAGFIDDKGQFTLEVKMEKIE